MLDKKIIQELVKNNKSKFIPEGRYHATVLEVEQRENEKGTNWISIICESSQIGKIHANYYFTDKAAKRAFRDLQKVAQEFDLNIDLNEFEDRELDYLCDVFGELVGTSVVVNVTGQVGNYNFRLSKVN